MFAFNREDRPADAFAALKDLKATMTHSKAQALSSESKGVKVLSGAVLKASSISAVPQLSSHPTVYAVPSVSAVRVVEAVTVVSPLKVASLAPQAAIPIKPIIVVTSEPIPVAQPVIVLPMAKSAKAVPVVVPKAFLPPR